MASYKPDPIKLNEYKQTDPMSFIFRDHYFKLESVEDTSAPINYHFPGHENVAYSAKEYTFTIGTIYTNKYLSKESDIDVVLDDVILDTMIDSSEHVCKTAKEGFIDDINKKNMVYDELMTHFAFYFNAAPYKASTKMVFMDGGMLYQLVVIAFTKDAIEKFKKNVFNASFSNITLNPKAFSFRLRKLDDPCDVDTISPVASANIDIFSNIKYGMKGIYELNMKMAPSLGKYEEVISKAINRSFVPMPFDLNTDKYNNVPTSSDETNVYFEYNYRCINSQYSKYMLAVMFSGLFVNANHLLINIFTNDALDNSPSMIKFLFDMNLTVVDDVLNIRMRALPTRVVIENITAKLDIRATDINNHEIDISFDDGYSGKTELLELAKRTQVYNALHHPFFSSHFNTKWVNPDDVFDSTVGGLSKFGFNYIAFISSDIITSQSESKDARFRDIDISSTTNEDGIKVVKYVTRCRTIFLCRSMQDAKHLKKASKWSGDVNPKNIYFPIRATPTLILYRSLEAVNKAGFLDIKKYDFLAVANVTYNGVDMWDKDVVDVIQPTDIINWGTITYPFINSKEMIFIPISPTLILIKNR